MQLSVLPASTSRGERKAVKLRGGMIVKKTEGRHLATGSVSSMRVMVEMHWPESEARSKTVSDTSWDPICEQSKEREGGSTVNPKLWQLSELPVMRV